MGARNGSGMPGLEASGAFPQPPGIIPDAAGRGKTILESLTGVASLWGVASGRVVGCQFRLRDHGWEELGHRHTEAGQNGPAVKFIGRGEDAGLRW